MAETNPSKTEITVEPFRSEWSDAVGKLIVSIQRDEFEIPITLEDQPDLSNISKYYQYGRGNFWVALHADKIVGTIALLDIGNDQVALRKMFVHPDYRGLPYRTAQKLLTTAKEWCRAKSIKQVYLGTTAKFLAAHRFYEKSGFLEVQKESLPQAFPIMTVDTKFYMTQI